MSGRRPPDPLRSPAARSGAIRPAPRLGLPRIQLTPAQALRLLDWLERADTDDPHEAAMTPHPHEPRGF